MRNVEDGQSCPRCNAHMTKTLNPAQRKLLEYLDALDGPDRVKALKWVHDVALYDSHEPLYRKEKEALYQVKVLWQLIEDTLPG
ncbi:hypothetical protein [Flagellimonas allohymeniacidonis]|uniref:Uncharacterized protein n=1 Tax=Flagellimonas allohymeniacidonis TaxID=2517819 RepID=A0A4Q8QDB0_9FLAO|nr:hypothetical protein [Allomuricauda hymeniacidonis]TAI47684.1 hypothetical protein EW142_13560 [Allomuricauda hymeniacidonis]